MNIQEMLATVRKQRQTLAKVEELLSSLNGNGGVTPIKSKNPELIVARAQARLGTTAKKSRKPRITHKASKLERSIVRVLSSEPLSAGAVMEKMHYTSNAHKVYGALARMHGRGEIIKHGRGTYSRNG